MNCIIAASKTVDDASSQRGFLRCEPIINCCDLVTIWVEDLKNTVLVSQSLDDVHTNRDTLLIPLFLTLSSHPAFNTIVEFFL